MMDSRNSGAATDANRVNNPNNRQIPTPIVSTVAPKLIQPSRAARRIGKRAVHRRGGRGVGSLFGRERFAQVGKQQLLECCDLGDPGFLADAVVSAAFVAMRSSWKGTLVASGFACHWSSRHSSC